MYTFCIQIVYKSPPYFCKGPMAISGNKKTVPSTLRLKIKVCPDFTKMVDISWHQNTTTTTITIYFPRSKTNIFALVYTEHIKIMNSSFTSIIFLCLWLSPLLCVGFAAFMVIIFWRFKGTGSRWCACVSCDSSWLFLNQSEAS